MTIKFTGTEDEYLQETSFVMDDMSLTTSPVTLGVRRLTERESPHTGASEIFSAPAAAYRAGVTGSDLFSQALRAVIEKRGITLERLALTACAGWTRRSAPPPSVTGSRAVPARAPGVAGGVAQPGDDRRPVRRRTGRAARPAKAAGTRRGQTSQGQSWAARSSPRPTRWRACWRLGLQPRRRVDPAQRPRPGLRGRGPGTGRPVDQAGAEGRGGRDRPARGDQ